jgi:hypothetical protein
MRELLAVLALSLALASAPTVIDWETTPPASGSVEAGSAVVAGPGTHLLVVIDRPDVSGPWFELSGQVSYTEVSEPSYLEMWSHFADGQAFFTRTLAEDGPMMALFGSSSDRRFALPFQVGGAEPPVRIELSVVLAGEGRVSVGPMTLTSASSASGWWTARRSGRSSVFSWAFWVRWSA